MLEVDWGCLLADVCTTFFVDSESFLVQVNGEYGVRAPDVIPAGFTATCVKMSWPHEAMWKKLSDGRRPWFEHSNGSYIYWNRSDGCWWIDDPSGAGVYIQKALSELPPEDGHWEPLNRHAADRLPQLRVKPAVA